MVTVPFDRWVTLAECEDQLAAQTARAEKLEAALKDIAGEGHAPSCYLDFRPDSDPSLCDCAPGKARTALSLEGA